MNVKKVKTVKKYTDEVINWRNMQEFFLRQKAKIDWLRLGDGNNIFFHENLKEKQRQTQMNTLHTSDGTITITQTKIEEEVLSFMET